MDCPSTPRELVDSLKSAKASLNKIGGEWVNGGECEGIQGFILFSSHYYYYYVSLMGLVSHVFVCCKCGDLPIAAVH